MLLVLSVDNGIIYFLLFCGEILGRNLGVTATTSTVSPGATFAFRSIPHKLLPTIWEGLFSWSLERTLSYRG
jgi:hypothetical protein